ncbi:FtsH protease activity modulator HflK [Sinimarinibacterium sp. CAU 1509]|uniref:FtsH protease activity modulator HflK n=1 Tax=Sinimarinibacterium sp. CAU 1509 TaxID=2562283 RepID=UPI0010AC8322|nr:FtsH protease activity modulator HflK [Sinimarinibacterium sp. CAU 1509]TJY60924.1 FtsH protease activity modulator HflK [Sinimarinibacterium sp. CAU 1509]
MAWNEPGPGRDPWNQGPKRGDGPPDLDAMLKRLRARFGGRGGSGGRPAGNLPAGMFGLVAAALVLLWVASGFYVVDEQERAVVLRFGNYVGTTDPGLRWRMPWPIEKEEVVNVTGVRATRDRATMLTQDENIVDLELTVQYRVSKVEDYVFNVADPDLTMRQATKSSVREIVGQSKMDFILTDGRQEIADRTKTLLQERMDEYKSGLFVTEVNLQQAQPPEPVQAAFADAIKAREDQQRLKNEAEAYANDRLPRARGAAARQVEEATGYRDQVVAKAEGDVARFNQLLTEYRKAPKITRERMYLDTMNTVYGNSSKILIDVDKGGQMLYLPLDQILKNSVPRQDSAADYVTAPSTPQRSGAVAPGGNDTATARSRDRGR